MPEIMPSVEEMLKILRNTCREQREELEGMKNEVISLKSRIEKLEQGQGRRFNIDVRRPEEHPTAVRPIFVRPTIPTPAMRETYKKYLGQYPSPNMTYDQVSRAIQESYQKEWSSRQGDKANSGGESK